MNVAAPRGFALLLSALIAQTLAGTEQRPQVKLATGTLVGTLPAGAPGAVFKGLPYAQPPVSNLRWREPLAVRPWTGARDASTLGPPCLQSGSAGTSGSEDCLYLNVWTAQWPVRTPEPVMLWLHGGANVVGSANGAIFDGAALARHGVVVVTMNYRLGVMGFMAHPALSAESLHRSSGNYTLLDQLMALRWIRANIARFGGDPRRVTVFGQSSGSYDLLLLMTSPLARGLFARAIAQSGQLLSYDGSMGKARAESIGVRIAAELQAPQGAGTLPYLRSLPGKQVATVAARFMPTALGSDTGLLTNVDGWVLPESPARVFAAGRQLAIPLIVGNNAREITPQTSVEELRTQIAAKYGELAPEALEAYGLANGGPGYDDPLLGNAGAQWMTDTVQRCAASLEAAWHAAAGNATWQYQFERTIPGRESAGSFHGAELAFVFGTLDRSATGAAAFGADDHESSAKMQLYWTRFARTGNPNGEGLPNWPRADGGNYLAFTLAGPVARNNLQTTPCRVFRDWTLRRLSH